MSYARLRSAMVVAHQLTRLCCRSSYTKSPTRPLSLLELRRSVRLCLGRHHRLRPPRRFYVGPTRRQGNSRQLPLACWRSKRNSLLLRCPGRQRRHHLPPGLSPVVTCRSGTYQLCLSPSWLQSCGWRTTYLGQSTLISPISPTITATAMLTDSSNGLLPC